MTIKSEKEEARRKILMVLEAIGKAASAKTLSEHPTLSGMSAKSVAMHLRVIGREKLVRRLRDGSWKPTKQRARPETNEGVDSMFFVINAEARTISLDVGGLRLPVRVE